MGPFKSLITATTLRYVVVMLCAPLGAYLVAKGLLSAEQWDGVQFYLEVGVPAFFLVLLGGGSLAAAGGAAWAGIMESTKDKAVLDGIKVPFNELDPVAKASIRQSAAEKAAVIGKAD